MIKNIKARLSNSIPGETWQYVLLATITLVALALRLYRLGQWSFWIDELLTWRDATRFFDLALTRRSTLRLLTLVAGHLLGVNEWNLRIIPALIGVFTIPILYFPLKKIFGVAIALSSMLLLAISPWHLLWSQNARFYVTLLLFYTLALLTFYLGLEKDRIFYLVLSMLFLGLAALESQIALLIVPVVIAYVVLVLILPFEQPAGLNLRNLAVFFGPGFVAASYFSLPFFLNGVWDRYFGGNTNTTSLNILVTVVYYVGLPAVCLGICGAIYFLFKRNRAVLLLSLSSLLPLMMIVFLARVQFTDSRYVFLSLVSWLVLAAVTIKALFSQSRRGARTVAIGLLLILLLTSTGQVVAYYHQNGHRENWKEALAFVRQHKEAEEQVLVTFNRLGWYYLPGQTASIREETLAEVKAGNRKVWFVEKVSYTRRRPTVQTWLEENTETITTFETDTPIHHYEIRVRLYSPARQNDNLVVK